MRERGESSRKGVNLKKRGKGTKKGRKINELSVVLIKNRNLSIEKKTGQMELMENSVEGCINTCINEKNRTTNSFVRGPDFIYIRVSRSE